MDNEIELGEAGRQYASAHAAHYVARDLPLALQLYKAVLASHPSTQEADYSRTQVQNLVNAVIPRQKLLEAQIELAVAHFEREGLIQVAEGTREVQAYEVSNSTFHQIAAHN